MKDVKEIIEENKKADADKMTTYEFADISVDCQLILKINLEKEKVEKLLTEYRTADEDYNTIDWIDFLQNKGYKVEVIEIEHTLFF